MAAPDILTIAVSRVDGGLTVLRIITTEYARSGAVNWTVFPTPEYIDEVIAKHNWQGGERAVSWRIVPNDIVDENTDRYFRNAWKDDGGNKPGVDMPRAREIHRERLRVMRTPLLEALDIEMQRADEAGWLRRVFTTTKEDISRRKQALRDVTDDPRIEAATTPEELKAVIPDALRA